MASALIFTQASKQTSTRAIICQTKIKSRRRPDMVKCDYCLCTKVWKELDRIWKIKKSPRKSPRTKVLAWMMFKL